MEKKTSRNLKTREIYTDWITQNMRYSDLDPNGHINNGAINAFFEDGRVQFRESYMKNCSENILTGFVLVKFSVEYLKVLSYPGSLDVGTMVSKVGRTSYMLAQALFSGKECAAIAEVVTVCIDRKSQKAKLINDGLRNILEKKLKAAEIA